MSIHGRLYKKSGRYQKLDGKRLKFNVAGTCPNCGCGDDDGCECCDRTERKITVCTFPDATPDRDLTDCVARGGTIEEVDAQCCQTNLNDPSTISETLPGTSECSDIGGTLVKCPGICKQVPVEDCPSCGCDGKCYAYLCDSQVANCTDTLPIEYMEMDCDCNELDFCDVCEGPGDGDIDVSDQGDSQTSASNCIQGGGTASGNVQGSASGFIQDATFDISGHTLVKSDVAGIEGRIAINGGVSDGTGRFITIDNTGTSLQISNLDGLTLGPGFWVLQSATYTASYSIGMALKSKTRRILIDENGIPFVSCEYCFDVVAEAQTEIIGTFLNAINNAVATVTKNDGGTSTIEECFVGKCLTIDGSAFIGENVPPILTVVDLSQITFTGAADATFGGAAQNLYPVCLGDKTFCCIDDDTGMPYVDPATGEAVEVSDEMDCPGGTTAQSGACSEVTAPNAVSIGGPGTELKKLLKAKGVPPCKLCNATADKMDRWGAERCDAEFESLVAEIRNNSKRHSNWIVRQLAKAASLTEATENKAMDLIRAELRDAIDQAKRKSL